MPPGAVLGARTGPEAVLEAKNWFVGHPLGSQNGAKFNVKIVEISYQKTSAVLKAFLMIFVDSGSQNGSSFE